MEQNEWNGMEQNAMIESFNRMESNDWNAMEFDSTNGIDGIKWNGWNDEWNL